MLQRSKTNKSTVVCYPRIAFWMSILAMAILTEGRIFAGSPALSTTELAALQLPDVEIGSVVHHEASDSRQGVTVAHVKLTAVIGNSIRMELLLPDEWNERFVMGGGMAYGGSPQTEADQFTNGGYATAGTDTGHQGGFTEWALNDLEAIVNFGHLAVHRTAVVAKALIRSYYGTDAKYNYFIGCSRGGGQGVMESQRYPNDFDGIVAGCPAAFDYTGLIAFELKVAQTMYPDPKVLDKTSLSKNDVEDLHKEVLRQLDSQDGVKDGIINDPLAVELDLSKVTSLNDTQKSAVQILYSGVYDNDELIHPGIPLGSEAEWFRWLVGPTRQGANLSHLFSTSFCKHFVFHDPDWDYSTYDFSNWRKDTQFIVSTMNADDPDLRPFAKLGGRLIIWHGWNDPAIPGKATIRYYNEVLNVDPRAKDYVRLFMIPGCGHCGRDPGASEVEWLNLIVDWVENQRPPNRIIARRTATDSAPAMTRPVFPYPQKAEYVGSGDVNDAANFRPVPSNDNDD